MHIETIAVIGSGPLGRGIASLAAVAGYRTILEDISASMLADGLGHVRKALHEAAARGEIAPEARDKALARLGSARSVDDASREADLIIETTPDDLEVKLEIFTLLDKFAKPGAILASNTALSVTDLAGITFCPDKCIGVQFTFPVQQMDVLKITSGSETSGDTVETCRAAAARMGKTVMLMSELPADTAPVRTIFFPKGGSPKAGA